MNPIERQLYLDQEFRLHFNNSATVWAKAPGRVDLMGSHTDYNQGYVLTLPLEQDTWIAARPRQDNKVVINSLNLDGNSEFDLNDIHHDLQNPWANYVRGVMAVLVAKGYPLIGFDGLVHSTIPLSSGLSSSAALEVATARLCALLGDFELDPVKLALFCQQAENQFVGMNCGILDQYTSSVGQVGCALLLDCRNLTSDIVNIHPDIRIVICNTKARRELTGSEYPERRAQCEAGAALLAGYYPDVRALRDVTSDQLAAHISDLPPAVAKRCQFILQENQRVSDLAKALPDGDRVAIREICAASFDGAKWLYEIISAPMELMLDAMLDAPGVIGARQAGAGFGGCMVAFVQASQVDEFSSSIQRAYAASSGIEAEVYIV